MHFSLYEEFPDREEDLAKLDEIDFPVDLVLAAEGLEKFLSLTERVKKDFSQVRNVIYWPKLNIKEGYWISPLSARRALDRVCGEIKGHCEGTENPRLIVHLDAEPPFLVNKCVAFMELPYFFAKRKKLREFLNPKNRGFELITCELPSFMSFKSLGLSYNPEQYNSRQVKMVYTSLGKMLPGGQRIFVDRLRNESEKGRRLYGGRFGIAIGCLAKGIMENELILTPDEFNRDLDILKKAGVRDVFIFRLGGLNQDYLEVMKQHLE